MSDNSTIHLGTDEVLPPFDVAPVVRVSRRPGLTIMEDWGVEKKVIQKYAEINDILRTAEDEEGMDQLKNSAQIQMIREWMCEIGAQLLDRFPGIDTNPLAVGWNKMMEQVEMFYDEKVYIETFNSLYINTGDPIHK